MSSQLQTIIAFAIAFAVLIAIRLLAGTNTIVGRICRAYWNISFKIASMIPLAGWMSRFIIADTEEEIRRKEDYINVGKAVDSMAADRIIAAGERQKEAEKERERLYNDIASSLGRRADIVVSENCEYVKIDGRDYTTQEVKSKLNIQ